MTKSGTAGSPPAAARGATSSSVLYFDGTCGFCDRTVNFLFARDKLHHLRFAPLQGVAAAAQLPESHRLKLDTVVFVDHGRTYTRSGAVLRAAARLGGRWRLAKLLLVIPSPLRDAVYRVIANNRYRWFGRFATCRLPSAAERAYFFD